jgi:dephospho-CoA kinase
MIIGITGGTGCGKTTLLTLIQQMGGLVLDCDAIYHQLLQTDLILLSAIEARFPGTVCNGTLDRKKLGNIVFSDEAALTDLNRITHGAVREAVLKQLACQPKLAAIDAIGLFEGDLANLCDVTVAITAPEEMRIRRLMERDGITEDYAKARIRAQHDDAWYRSQCSHALENAGDPSQFAGKCLAFLESLGIMKENT